ncbi:hypothetical protein [Oceanobacter kriegii]|uniref:hypothetical protein n=1 Tax=Oceanobacter kriegii TaxID=64972 RepID=UPI00040B2A78|nr:hypothetical protein [Oceanobacter kriegii]
MQFTMPALVLGANHYNIDGVDHVSLSVMEADPSDKSLKGYRPAKLKANVTVFEELTGDVSDFPKQVNLVVQNRVSKNTIQQTCIAIAKDANGKPAAKAM